jgi:hypothetical protein
MNFLKKPYPLAENVPSKITTILSAGIFIGLFILLFQPFGIAALKVNYKSAFLLGFGLVTMVVLAFSVLVMPKLFQSYFCESNWTVGRQIAFMLFIVFMIGLANYFYSGLFFRIADNWLLGMLSFQGFTLLIGIFPITGATLYSYNKYLRNNLRDAMQVNTRIVDDGMQGNKSVPGKMIYLPSVNQSDLPVEVLQDDFLFVRSDGNYLDVYFLDAGNLQHSLIRNTLVTAQSMLHDHFPPLVRCHRSFIVNLDRIEKVDGNAQGLVLKMKGCEEKVPVSRKYIEELKSKLN